MTKRLISGPAGGLHLDDGGSGSSGGPPVVFTHSFGGTSAQWTEQLRHLRPNRRAIAFDFRGHGQSETARDGDYRIDGLIADLDAVTTSLELERFVLVGHGLGSIAAIGYADEHPNRVAGLLLAVPPGNVPPEQAAQLLGSLRADYDQVSSGIIERLLKDARPEVRLEILAEAEALPRDAALQLIDANFSYDPLPALRRFEGPKLAVTAAGGETPFDLHRLEPSLAHESLSGTSHWLQMDDPKGFDRILDGFLARVDAEAQLAPR